MLKLLDAFLLRKEKEGGTTWELKEAMGLDRSREREKLEKYLG